MDLSFKEVDQILRIVEEFPASEVRFEYGDLKLYVRHESADDQDSAAGIARYTAPAPPVTTKHAKLSTEPHVPASPVQVVAAAAHESATPEDAREGLISVSAPMMGVYYAAPAPDAEPFVKLGQHVSEGAEVCIIEVMKIMNLIKAPCAGEVVQLVAENGQMVERDGVILRIRPDAKSET